MDVATHITSSAGPNAARDRRSTPVEQVCASTDCHSTLTFFIAANATGNTNVNDGTSLGNKKPNVAGVGTIKGYPEKGKNSWRAFNDQLFKNAAKAFDKAHKLKSGDSLYLTGKQIKAWAMVESGGSKKAFTTDPLQVNNPGDFTVDQGEITGLRKNEVMTPQKSTNAALKWFWHRGTIHDKTGKVTGYRSLHDAFSRYNSNMKNFPNPKETHAEWYADKVIRLGGG